MGPKKSSARGNGTPHFGRPGEIESSKSKTTGTDTSPVRKMVTRGVWEMLAGSHWKDSIKGEVKQTF